MKTAYLVIPDGQGEIEVDFTVLVVKADSPEEACARVTDPKQGYGKKTVYVAKLEDVTVFKLREELVARSVPWGDVVAEASREMRDLLDPDKLVHQ